MIDGIILGAMLLGAATNGPSAPPPVPLQPIGKWTVEYNPNMCVLAHAYGDPAAPLTFALRPWPLGSTVELVLLTPEKPGPTRRGIATVKVGNAPEVKGDYISWTINKAGKRVSTITIEIAGTDLIDAKAIAVAIGRAPPISVAPPPMKPALAALKVCNDDLISGWGINPAERDLVATPAIGSAANWITSDDYPAEALSAGFEGEVTILWTIDTDGRVKDCRVVGSSGSPALDAAPCMAVTRRGRYIPAKGQDGKPIATHGMRHVIWRLP